MTGRAFVISMLTVAVVAAVTVRSCAPDPAPLPAKIVTQIQTKTVHDALDSATIVRLQGENARLLQRVDAKIDTARHIDSVARVAHDSAETAAAAPAPDWQNAFRLKSIEAGNLWLSGAKKDTAIAELRDTLTARTDTVHQLERAGKLRADSLSAAVLQLAEHRDRCAVFFDIIKCPSRKKVAAAALVLGGAAGYAIATKKEINLVLVKLRF